MEWFQKRIREAKGQFDFVFSMEKRWRGYEMGYGLGVLRLERGGENGFYVSEDSE